MKPSEFLRQNEWCKGSLAKDKNGDCVSLNDPSAVSFCANGVIYKGILKENVGDMENFSQIVRAIIKERKGRCLSISSYNDRFCGSKEELISIFEEAERRIENESFRVVERKGLV